MTTESPNSQQALGPTELLDRISQDIDAVLRQEMSVHAFLAGKTLAEIERLAIIATIRACRGNKAASARTLGISEKSIYNKMRRLNIKNSDLVSNGSSMSDASASQSVSPQPVVSTAGASHSTGTPQPATPQPGQVRTYNYGGSGQSFGQSAGHYDQSQRSF